ncbi:hypothetical protein SAV31267_070080 [Streptomyces avermitilis]|uniref:Uncharacterized protein n=1 Tax=Streptomyces avermitilis TaxID=33903 RepID=A0A4D4MZG2_STRAX|nr:hypothetical protein SAV31267_070080 [Streptomyces avermitilis]
MWGGRLALLREAVAGLRGGRVVRIRTCGRGRRLREAVAGLGGGRLVLWGGRARSGSALLREAVAALGRNGSAGLREAVAGLRGGGAGSRGRCGGRWGCG